jgi:hypothetical protein
MTNSQTEPKGYNGWTNYATWGVALVLDNDQYTYEQVREQVQIERNSVKSNGNVIAGIWTEEDAVRFELADWLKDYTEMLCGLEDEGLGIPEPSLMDKQVISAGLAEDEEIADNMLAD